MAISNSKLFGVADEVNLGGIYSANLDGSNAKILKEIGEENINGDQIYREMNRGMLLSGSTIYGSTSTNFINGTKISEGVIFSLETDGSDFTILHEFAGGALGEFGASRMTLVGSKLYGTSYGGEFDNGLIFSINSDGTDYQVLHSFTGGADDGSGFGATANLTQVDDYLYGVTKNGGDADAGVIYAIKLDGSDYQLIHEFSGTDGTSPLAGLTSFGSLLFGTAAGGGDHNDGVIFSVQPVPEPASCVLVILGMVGLLSFGRFRSRKSAKH